MFRTEALEQLVSVDAVGGDAIPGIVIGISAGAVVAICGAIVVYIRMRRPRR